MRRATAELIVKDPNKFAHHDRVFLNNPVAMPCMTTGSVSYTHLTLPTNSIG